MKRLFAIVKFIAKHPLASKNKLYSYGLFFRWQIGQWLVHYPSFYPLIEDSAMMVEKGMTGATGNIYTGLLEFNDMCFLLHALRKDDLFGDIGANVGVYTILAAKNAGSMVMAAEPVPVVFDKLKRNVFLNDVSEQVRMVAGGIGSQAGELAFTSSLDTVNHVLSEAELAVADREVVKVPIFTLDTLCEKRHPVLLKIDVEGFEWEVLKGASDLLAGNDLKAIIIELNGSGARYGYSDEEIHALLLKYNFLPYEYEPFERKLTKLETHGLYNTIYIRDLGWANDRTRTAKKFRILKEFV